MDDFKWNLEVDAPTFVNFFSLDDGKENAESYFERKGNLPTIKRENLTPPDKSVAEVSDINNKRSPLQNAINKNSDARHRDTQQDNKQTRHRRSSSVPAVNRELLIVKQEPVAELSAQLDDCKISDKKTTIKLRKTSRCQSKDSLYGSSSTINSHYSYRSSKLNGATTKNKFMSTAELVRKFEKETPKRYHTVSSKADAKALLQDLATKINIDKELVLPKTPKLLTKSRNRPVTAVGFEMREEMEFEMMKKYKMKARPMNKDVLQKRTTGPSVQRRPTTKPEPFKLTEVLRKPITQITENFVFTAKPVPRHVIEGQGVKSKVAKKLPTVPVTPKVLKYKSKQPEVPETLKKDKEDSRSIMPRRTVLQPFSFESRYKDAERKKEEKLNQILEEQNRLREFQSKPMPVFKTPVKNKAPHNPVIAKSPKFASKELMIEKQQRFKMKVEEEERAKQQAAEFKAKPCVVIYKRPFQPEIVDKVIEMDDFQLHSEIRAKQRQEFDAKMKLKEEKKMEELKQKEQQVKEEEAKLNTELRKQTIHKAQPIKKFKPINSFDAKEPTVPESPMFASKHRTQMQKNE